MIVVESPAKLNLSLLVSPPKSDGYHPLQSMVQTIEWCDRLDIELGEREDRLEIEGSDLAVEDNLVLSALTMLRQHGRVPPLALTLHKEIPIEAGLGGGSSNAAAMLWGAEAEGWATSDVVTQTAKSVGADVSLFLVGGSLEMSGVGDVIKSLRRLEGFAVAVVVPEFGLSSADVYRRWDEMEGPEGDVVPDDLLPPSLRDQMPMRNDLSPAALDVDPRLGDFMADVRMEWGGAVCLTGSGSACFGYFGTAEEAAHAVTAVAHLTAATKGAALRPRGVAQT
jgi:4-diphosphocytidyl-2-C-methyl-D-erythritol kinase